jgi:hypothetical protein
MISLFRVALAQVPEVRLANMPSSILRAPWPEQAREFASCPTGEALLAREGRRFPAEEYG